MYDMGDDRGHALLLPDPAPYSDDEDDDPSARTDPTSII
jgi:hypothetical protein